MRRSMPQVQPTGVLTQALKDRLRIVPFAQPAVLNQPEAVYSTG